MNCRQHAAAGDLHKPEVLLAQTKRMIQDDRTRALGVEFGGNWLDFRRFEEHNSVDRNRFPEFTNELRQAMFEEPIRFFLNVCAARSIGARFSLRRLHVREPRVGEALRHADSEYESRPMDANRRHAANTVAAGCRRWRCS